VKTGNQAGEEGGRGRGARRGGGEGRRGGEEGRGGRGGEETHLSAVRARLTPQKPDEHSRVRMKKNRRVFHLHRTWLPSFKPSPRKSLSFAVGRRAAAATGVEEGK